MSVVWFDFQSGTIFLHQIMVEIYQCGYVNVLNLLNIS